MRVRALALLAAVALAAPAPAAARAHPVTFSGSCQFAGPIAPGAPITVVPVPGSHFSYSGSGTCDGQLGRATVRAAPISVSFVDVSTLFDTCEFGPDFNLPGEATIGAKRTRGTFEITVQLARAALAGPFALTTPGGGFAAGVAQFTPADSAAAPQQCLTTGVANASLSAQFQTLAPLVGTSHGPRRH